MGAFDEANRLAIQYGCGHPLWSEQTTYAGAPNTVGDGVSMGGSPAYLLCIDLRENVAYRTLRISVSDLDDTADYTVELNATPVTYNAIGGDTEEDILAGILALIVASGPLNALVLGAVTGTGGDALLTLTGKAEADYSLDDLSATAAGELTCVADPTSLDFRVWANLAQGDTSASAAAKAPRWRLVNGAGGTLDYRGMVDQPLCGGVSNIYVELYSVTGAGDAAGAGGVITYAPTILIAPAQVS